MVQKWLNLITQGRIRCWNPPLLTVIHPWRRRVNEFQWTKTPKMLPLSHTTIGQQFNVKHLSIGLLGHGSGIISREDCLIKLNTIYSRPYATLWVSLVCGKFVAFEFRTHVFVPLFDQPELLSHSRCSRAHLQWVRGSISKWAEFVRCLWKDAQSLEVSRKKQESIDTLLLFFRGICVLQIKY